VGKREAREVGVLPPYSPELNLIERVCSIVKKKMLYDEFYGSLWNFKAAAINLFKSIEYNDELMSQLDGGFEGLHYT